MNITHRGSLYGVAALLLSTGVLHAGPETTALSVATQPVAALAGAVPLTTLSIGHTAFQPTEDSPYTLSFPRIGALSTRRSWLVTPVQLPHGARVKSMLCYLFDEDYEQDIQCRFVKYRLADGEWTPLGSARSDVRDYGAVRVAVELEEQIDNLDYTYSVYAYPAEGDMEWPDGPRMGVKGVSIGYEPPDI